MSQLQRPVHPMPADVEAVLNARGLRAAFDARPPYQRSEWVTWIDRAKRDETRASRIAEMLSELKSGHGYMGLEWRPGGDEAE